MPVPSPVTLERLRAQAEALGLNPSWGDVAMARLERRRADSGKVCSACRTKRALSAFGKRASVTDGLDTTCRECRSVANRAAYRRRTESV